MKQKTVNECVVGSQKWESPKNIERKGISKDFKQQTKNKDRYNTQ
jgi:hypothetical protein